MKVDPIYTEAVLALMARPEEFVPASALAPIVKMHPSVIIEYAKNGNWPFCKYCDFIDAGLRMDAVADILAGREMHGARQSLRRK